MSDVMMSTMLVETNSPTHCTFLLNTLAVRDREGVIKVYFFTQSYKLFIYPYEDEWLPLPILDDKSLAVAQELEGVPPAEEYDLV